MSRLGETTESAEERERRCEVEATQDGLSRLFKKWSTSPHSKVYFDRLSAKIEEFRESANSRRGPGQPQKWVNPLRRLGNVDTLAFITLSTVLESACRPSSLEEAEEALIVPEEGRFPSEAAVPETRLATSIGNECEREHFCQWLLEHGASRPMQSATKSHDPKHRRKRLSSLSLFESYRNGSARCSPQEWFALGKALLAAAKEAGLLEEWEGRRRFQGGLKTPSMVSAKRAAL